MSVRVAVERATRTVHSTFSGTISVADFLAGRDFVAQAADFSPTFSHIMDFTTVTKVGVDEAVLRQLAELPSLFERDAIQVMVVAVSSPVFKMAQTFHALAAGSGRNMRVAESLAEAQSLVAAFG